MAHLDEIALLVVRIESDGQLVVTNLGGAFPWKWGEGPVQILAPDEALTGILSFGGIHTNDPASVAAQARERALTWADTRVFTGLSAEALAVRGVRAGTRVVLHPSRRGVTELGDFLAAPFLDDRADLAAMLLALEDLGDAPEAGGIGSCLRRRRRRKSAGRELSGCCVSGLPTVGIALEIGPRVPESLFPLDEQPTVWVNDSYSAMQAADIDLVARAAAAHRANSAFSGPVARGQRCFLRGLARSGRPPITLAFAAENSHGYEIMHRHAVPNLAALLTATLREVVEE